MKPIGWRYESTRHSLAAQGMKTGRRYNMAIDAAALQQSLKGIGLIRPVQTVAGRVPTYTTALGFGTGSSSITPMSGSSYQNVINWGKGGDVRVLKSSVQVPGRYNILPIESPTQVPTVPSSVVSVPIMQSVGQEQAPAVRFAKPTKIFIPQNFGKAISNPKPVYAAIMVPVRLANGQVTQVNLADLQRFVMMNPGARPM